MHRRRRQLGAAKREVVETSWRPRHRCQNSEAEHLAEVEVDRHELEVDHLASVAVTLSRQDLTD